MGATSRQTEAPSFAAMAWRRADDAVRMRGSGWERRGFVKGRRVLGNRSGVGRVVTRVVEAWRRPWRVSQGLVGVRRVGMVDFRAVVVRGG